jgi:hypothetical protein
MKTTLYDLTTRGIIFVAEGNVQKVRWEMSMMRSCILDTNIFRIGPGVPLYNTITNESIQDQFFVTGRGPIPMLGDINLKNHYFIEKQRIAKLIHPLVKALTNNLYSRSILYIEDNALPMDDTIAIAIINSDPDNSVFSPGVLEYASTLGITPAQAYLELKIDYETVHGIKMRVFALSKKYAALIRAVTTQEQADLLLAEINQKLYSETFI